MAIWHPVTFTLDGPEADEGGSVNPFSDYAMTVTFRQSGSVYKVPGYFAACGDAAETSCTSGNKWRVHFTPDSEGTWSYEISFLEGSDVALNGGGTAVADLDGLTGSFNAGSSNKTAPDFRAPDRGRLSYQGAHYLQFPNGDPFFKLGADSPENTLAYEDFDATPNRGGELKDWWPHLGDFSLVTNGNDYLWQNSKGEEILGAWAYLADKGVNAVSFLTFSLGGDDQNIFPHLMKVTITEYNDTNSGNQWDRGVHHDRFDVSKLDQWDRVFSFADEAGLFLHFKTMETENDQLMDDGAFGRERQLYYRELIARFGHHLALNWNLGEEYTLSTETARQTLDYIKETDPYGHLRVLHTYPDELEQRYEPLLGLDSELTGASIQTSNKNFNEVRDVVGEWVTRSRDEGERWVVSLDEPGSANRGVAVDQNFPDGELPDLREQDDNRTQVRQKVLWNTLTVGGAGVEYYYGYKTGCGDLSCQDHDTRAQKWDDGAYAIAFFENYVGAKALNMVESDTLLTDAGVSEESVDVGVYQLPDDPKTFAIEAEDIGENPPGDWVFENDKSGFTGTGYYRWSGPDLFNIKDAGRDPIGYVVEIPAADEGDFRFVFRARRIDRNDGRTDLNNDLWMRIIDMSTGQQVQPNGEPGQEWWKMFFSGSLTDWEWSSSLDREDGVKIDATYDLSAGQYKIELSGRSTEFHLDRMTLNKGTNRSRTTTDTVLPDGTITPELVAAVPGASNESNYLFAEPGEIYVAYLTANADKQVIDLTSENGTYTLRWYDPISGGSLQSGSVTSVTGGEYQALGSPPSNSTGEWVALLERD